MRIGSLFSGIGGLELGLEWAGVGETQFQVEIDDYCRAVLAKHWPAVARFADIRTVGAHNLPPVDVLCGGFPCQDISNAGKRAGITGARSGLWAEFARIIRELRPRYVVVENVGALLVRGLDTVLGDLAAAGYDAEWDVLSAADVGAPHLRRRVFLIAWRADTAVRGVEGEQLPSERWQFVADPNGMGTPVADAGRPERRPRIAAGDNSNGTDAGRQETPSRVGKCCQALADAAGSNSLGERLEGQREGRAAPRSTDRPGDGRDSAWWSTEPDVGRVAHGVRARVDRLRALGNAVVPQCAEVVGRRLLEIADCHPISFFPAAAAGSDALARQGEKGV